jgi:predicted lipid-binding transport protein (Tim44 family)
MKHLLLALCVFVTGSMLSMEDAEAARRMGGGKSIGMQRNVAPPAQAPAAAATAPGASAGAAAAAQPARNRWLGPIAGLAAGLGLAALFSHLGLGEGFGTFMMILLLVAAAYFLFRMMRRSPRQEAPLQYAGGPRDGGFATHPRAAPTSLSGTAGAGAAGSIPVGFDVEGFLRQAKVNFVRLQAAHDSGNLEDIREFATPEVFAEVTLDIKARAGATQQTDVVVLNADLLDVSEEGRQYIASVRFHGSLREEADGAPQPFDETWHLAKPMDGSRGWQVAGIQQNA